MSRVCRVFYTVCTVRNSISPNASRRRFLIQINTVLAKGVRPEDTEDTAGTRVLLSAFQIGRALESACLFLSRLQKIQKRCERGL